MSGWIQVTVQRNTIYQQKETEFKHHNNKAGLNLFRNWKLLVHHLNEVKDDKKIHKIPKEKAREMLKFLLNSDAVATLAFQLGGQSITN